MNDDDKMFLEFMDYLAFEEYEREQEQEQRELDALFDGSDDDDDDDESYYSYMNSVRLENPLKNKKPIDYTKANKQMSLALIPVSLHGIYAFLFKALCDDPKNAGIYITGYILILAATTFVLKRIDNKVRSENTGLIFSVWIVLLVLLGAAALITVVLSYAGFSSLVIGLILLFLIYKVSNG